MSVNGVSDILFRDTLPLTADRTYRQLHTSSFPDALLCHYFKEVVAGHQQVSFLHAELIEICV